MSRREACSPFSLQPPRQLPRATPRQPFSQPRHQLPRQTPRDERRPRPVPSSGAQISRSSVGGKAYITNTVNRRQVLPPKPKTQVNSRPNRNISQPQDALELKWGDSPCPKVCSCDNAPCPCAGHSSLPAKKIPKGRLVDGSVRDAAKLLLMRSLPAPARERFAAPAPARSLLPKLAIALKEQQAAYESLEKLGLLLNTPPEICTTRCDNLFDEVPNIQSGDVATKEAVRPPEAIPPKEIKEDPSEKASGEMASKNSSKSVHVKLRNFTSDVATETHLEKGISVRDMSDSVVFGSGSSFFTTDLDGRGLLIDALTGENETQDTSLSSDRSTIKSLFDFPMLKQHACKLKKGIDSCVSELMGVLKNLSLPSESIYGYILTRTEHFHYPIFMHQTREYDKCQFCKVAAESSKYYFQRCNECSESMKINSANSCTTLFQDFEIKIEIDKVQKEINTLFDSTHNNDVEVVNKSNDCINNDNNAKPVSHEENSAKRSGVSKISQIFSLLSPYMIDEDAAIPADVNDRKEYCIKTWEAAYNSNYKEMFYDILSLYALLNSVKNVTMHNESTINKLASTLSPNDIEKKDTRTILKLSTDAESNTESSHENYEAIKDKSYTVVTNIAKTSDKSLNTTTELSEVIKHDSNKHCLNTMKLDDISKNINEGVGVKILISGHDNNCNIDGAYKTTNELPAHRHTSKKNKKTLINKAKTLYRLTVKRAKGVIANVRQKQITNLVFKR